MWQAIAGAVDGVRGSIGSFYSSNDGALHTGALLLFTALLPFFSVAAIASSRRSARMRSAALHATFPDIGRSRSYEAFSAANGSLSLWQYAIPLIFLVCLNTYFSGILLDANRSTDTEIQSLRKVFLLCAGHCYPTGQDADAQVSSYETQTLIAVAYAFLGWTIWSFRAIFDRAAAQQLFPATFNRLLIRLAIAVLVAIVAHHLAAETVGTAVGATLADSGPVFAFMIGMFPERGLAWIEQKFSNFVRTPEHSDDLNLELIEGIDPNTVYRLQEVGIEDGADLARANPFTIFELVAIPMTEAVDLIAQAQLLLLFKPDKFQTLQKAGYRTTFDVVRLLRGPNGAATLQALCNWVIPQGYDQADAITSDGDYRRLLEVNEAMGTAPP